MRLLIFGSGTIGSKISVCAKKLKINNILFSRFKKKGTLKYNYSIPLSDQLEINEDDIGVLSFGISDQSSANKDKKKTFLVNYRYTKNIIDIFIKKNIYFIFFSSAAVFGSENKKLFTISSKPSPQTYYGILKARLEEYIKRNTKNFLIIRTGWVSNLENNCVIKKIYNELKENRCTIFSEARTNLIILDDFVKILFKLMIKKTKGIKHISKGFISRKKIAKAIINQTGFRKYKLGKNDHFNYRFIISSNRKYEKKKIYNFIKKKINFLINQNL